MSGWWLVAALLLAAVAALASLAWWRARGRRAMMRSPEEAVDAAAAALPGLAARDAVLGNDGRSALVLATDGRVVVVTANGRARTVPWAALRQSHDGVVVETGRRRAAGVLLKGVNALDVRRLGAPVTS